MTQPTFRARSSAPIAITAFLAFAVALLLTATAHANSFTTPFSTPTAASGTPGVPASAASSQATAAVLQQATGLTPAQVTDQSVCAPQPQGYAACAAEVLVKLSDHRYVRPRTHARRTFTQVFPSVRTGIAPQDATPQTAGTPPAPLTPAYLQQAYDLTYLSQTRGTGDIVAVVDAYDDPTAEGDLNVFRSTYGLPTCTTANGCFKQMNENGDASPVPPVDKNWEMEISLDLDAISALCPNCKIRLYEGLNNSVNDLVTAANTAAAQGANEISNSWLAYWAGTGFPGTLVYPGVSVIAATGDHGYQSTSGYANYPAALPGVTAAGGTAVVPASDGKGGRGFGESAWSLVSGWGASSGCNTLPGITKPFYQTDTGCTGRSYSDVSAAGDPSTGLNVYDTGNGGWLQVGGTSLATPLIAAFEAVTGINGASPKWAYDQSSLLNDPITGSSGTCPAAYTYICNARVGYDGPTGMGAISGALATGAPGIGGPSVGTYSQTYHKAVTATSATLVGGVYPNSLDTTYYWQYGPTTSYGQQTSPVDVGSGQAPAVTNDTIPGLTPNTVYHYRMVAHNSQGTTYGYDYSLTTSASTSTPPSNLTAPTIIGSAQQGQTLTATKGTWTAAITTYAYQWQRSADHGATWSNISGATVSAYIPDAADLGVTLQVNVTAINSYGQASATSASVGPVSSGAPANTVPPALNGTAQQGQTLTASSGSWNPAGSSYAYQWQRSTDAGASWSGIAGQNTSTYLAASADIGSELRVTVTATNPYGVVELQLGGRRADRVRRSAGHERPERERLDLPGPGTHRQRHLEPGGQQLHLPVAALDGPRNDLDEHRRRHDHVVHVDDRR